MGGFGESLGRWREIHQVEMRMIVVKITVQGARGPDTFAGIPMTRTARSLALGALALAAAAGVSAQQVLNLYSARHYQTDEALYANFTKETGIRSEERRVGKEC